MAFKNPVKIKVTAKALGRQVEVFARPGSMDAGIANEVMRGDYYGVNGLTSLKHMETAVIVDIGAHVGYFARLCQELWPNSRVLCFEAEPKNVPVLKKNTKGLNVQVFHKAVVGDDRKEINFWSAIDSGLPNTGGGTVRATGGVTVEACNFDFVMEQVHALDPPNDFIALLKFDCEASEGPILRYAADHGYLDHVGFVRGEYHGEQNRTAVIDILKDTHVVMARKSGGPQGHFSAHRRVARYKPA